MTHLQPLSHIDVASCDHYDPDAPHNILTQFNADTAEHRMHIHQDNGLYRHLTFARDDSTMFRFDLITWPGFLAITGDIGDYVFSRVADMFTFFTSEITPDYYAEKLCHGPGNGRDSVRYHDEDRFLTWVYHDFWEYSRDLHPTTARKWWESLREQVFEGFSDICIEDRHSCIQTLMRLPGAPEGHYDEVYEADWSRYDLHFELCLAAITTGIRTYNAYHTM